ncbi:hypothetical protein [Actinomadura sp. WMMA1423]|uniref:hypothetical protein n=1 Tax=Actinomadura sp. WMMA1423 TaxID=2591108 RepID=UPI001147664E|nr:hypothetical protein [Actinomadura sp. WMMA1423]
MTLQSTDPRAVYELLALRTEYAVRTSDGLHDTIVPVGDEALMRQTVSEFLDQGQDAEPVYRTVTAWAVDEPAAEKVRRDRARDHLLSIAQNAWEQHGDEVDELIEEQLRRIHLARQGVVRKGLTDADAIREIETQTRAALRDMLAKPLAETAEHSCLGEAARLLKLVELMGELTHQEAVEDDKVAPDLGQDRRSLLDDAERRVNEAADALYGGAS